MGDGVERHVHRELDGARVADPTPVIQGLGFSRPLFNDWPLFNDCSGCLMTDTKKLIKLAQSRGG